MLKQCFKCSKGELTGKVVSRKGQEKKKGGTGSKICRSSKRTFFANLQPMRILVNGHPRRVYVCAKCIKKGDFARA